MRIIILATMLIGFATTQASGGAFEDLPVAPQLQYSPAWLMEEYFRQSEMHSLMPSAQLPDLRDWDGLRRLPRNTKIRVVAGDFKRTKGRSIEADEQRLKFKANGKVVILNRANVRMVSLRFGPSTGERILLGLLEGAMIGAITYAEASLCEKHGCQDDRTGEWYEGSGKSYSARTGYVAAGIGAVGMGILAAHAKPEDVVIYFQQEHVPPAERQSESAMAPVVSRVLKGGNTFAPVTNSPATSW